MDPCIAFDSSVYSRLPSYEDVTCKFFGMDASLREHVLRECEELVRGHELQDIVGIDIKHKHFGMPQGHLLCEKQDVESKLSVMAPIVPEEFTGSLTPFAFAFSDGQWLPYEFVSNCMEAVDHLEVLLSKPDFMHGLASILLKSGLSDVLGFHVLHRSHLVQEARGTIETPGAGEHELLIRPYSEDLVQELAASESHPVMWHWCVDKMRPKTHTCVVCICHHCGSHCNSHK